MSNQGIARPSLARTHTRSSEAKRNEALDQGVRVVIDGDEFVVRVGDVTPALAAELRRHAGMSFMKLMNSLSDDPDVDLLTAFEWLARRVRGEDVAFEDVEFSYEDVFSDAFDVEAAGPAEVTEDVDGEKVIDPQT